MSLFTLPREIRFEIYRHTPAFNLLLLSHTCRTIHLEINSNPSIYKAARGYLEYTPDVILESEDDPATDPTTALTESLGGDTPRLCIDMVGWTETHVDAEMVAGLFLDWWACVRCREIRIGATWGSHVGYRVLEGREGSVEEGAPGGEDVCWFGVVCTRCNYGKGEFKGWWLEACGCEHCGLFGRAVREEVRLGLVRMARVLENKRKQPIYSIWSSAHLRSTTSMV
ncbi:hypothetical protein BJ508DRAFT_416823 [Ascobolus immersus RN42]|uniref:F-box domain-containing protein n=1 Tax=Ascobolus immersus RN42 TaxID=1160509 RepID=A0A3N4HVK1_ASCIM|nr:hypothetical protein BJ508DRAFT_416823 [Ascobolus immersus RN42]